MPTRSHQQRATHPLSADVAVADLADRTGLINRAFDLARLPLVLTDPHHPDHPIVYANAAFLALTGYPAEEVLGRNCRFLQGPATDPAAVRAIGAALATHTTVQVDLVNYRRDGTPFWNSVSIGPIRGDDGEVRYYFGSQLDVTRRHHAETAFREAQRMEVVGHLSAGLAHDFNNMLQVVLGNLERARTHAGDPAALHRAIERAQRGAQQATAITRQMLTFVRGTRSEARLADLNTLIRHSTELASRGLGDRIQIRLALDAGLPRCVMDAALLERALLNLLVNARDAIPRGGTAIVSTALVEPAAGSPDALAGRNVMVAVSDEGHGMPPEVLRRATEPLFTTKGEGHGTGLGLPMVKGFVQEFGGRLEIESEPGRGTTVRMLFPGVSRLSGSLALGSVADAVAAPIADPCGGTETILVVEDRQDVLEVAVAALNSLGYQVLQATSGEAALCLLRRELAKARLAQGELGYGDLAQGELALGPPAAPVRLLFADLVMPGGMDGVMLAEQACRLSPGLRVLLTTGWGEEVLTQEPSAAGMDVLRKPYLLADLAGRVRAALDRPDGQVRNGPLLPGQRPPGQLPREG